MIETAEKRLALPWLVNTLLSPLLRAGIIVVLLFNFFTAFQKSFTFAVSLCFFGIYISHDLYTWFPDRLNRSSV